MAQIASSATKNILKIQAWHGLNESPDGDTGLKNGEAAEMRNFRITREGHLQIRPGYGAVCTLGQTEADGTRHPVRGLWRGYVAGERHLLAACGGHLWDIDLTDWSKADLGSIHDGPTTFFGFSRKVYLLTGNGYYVWSGTGSVAAVEGYVPLVVTASPPAGGGTVLEGINKLTGKRRQRFSPDGSSTVYQLAESGIDEVISVEGTTASYTANLTAGTVTFSTAPEQGTNTVTITYRKGTGDRDKVTSMRFSEMFGGSDSRVFLYGDGTNECIFSGLDENGQASAEYFPDLNVAAVGTANTPLTALIRHYDRLLAFKPDGAWSMEYTTVTLDNSQVVAAVTLSTINREIGCQAPGQAQLVDNNPRTLFGSAVYTWPLSNSAIRDERNAKRLSDPVTTTLTAFDLGEAITFDDNDEQEYYVIYDSQVLVHNYGANAWYYYTNLPATCMEKVDGTVYFGTPDGVLMEFSRRYRNDNMAEIDAYWESGSMAFDREWMRKYSSLVWVGIKPESQAVLYMTAQSNIKSNYPVKVISAGLATFEHVNFNRWSFRTNRKPQVVRAKLKVKKATFYKLVLYSKSASATATIVSVDIQLKYTGNVK